jgi:methylenetetrahydrofolate--tRNA-(uracil-5-)-methyltransferase
MDGPAELDCSNSYRRTDRRPPSGCCTPSCAGWGSIILGEADRCRVPAGEALAVDRERFSAGVERELATAPGLERYPARSRPLPRATWSGNGPLTSDALTAALSPLDRDKALHLRLHRADRRRRLGG